MLAPFSRRYKCGTTTIVGERAVAGQLGGSVCAVIHHSCSGGLLDLQHMCMIDAWQEPKRIIHCPSVLYAAGIIQADGIWGLAERERRSSQINAYLTRRRANGAP
uniref:Uncharacterized protein n=1 Tax=Oryza barthii TaxID=65489 RepID=A0A0D3HPL1_9ORYZ